MAKKHMKKYSTFLVMKGLQIKTALKFHPPQSQELSSRNKRQQMQVKMAWECKQVQPLWKSIWSFIKKLFKKPTLCPCHTTLGHVSGGV
jgi:hypothetical protein